MSYFKILPESLYFLFDIADYLGKIYEKEHAQEGGKGKGKKKGKKGKGMY